MHVLQEFLEFIEQSRPQPVRHLLRRVLVKSRQLTGAEAGTVFIVRGRGRHRALHAIDAQNEVIRIKAADFVVPISTSSLAGYTATTGETVFVDDLYAIPGDRPYRFDRSFDTAHGYRSQSMLCFPLLNYDRAVIGVVQLINRRDPDGAGPLPFAPEQADLIVPFTHIVGSAVERAAMVERIADKNKRLHERNRLLAAQRERIAALQLETEAAFQISITLLARAAEIHDETTAHHVERVNEYSYLLARELGLAPSFCDELRFSAQLHDVGKMSVNVAILRKTGRLDADELAEMMRHPTYGYQILSASDRLAMAAEIALNHHERWDGTGYPNRRRGGDIPMSARIVTVADVYDALRSPRPYKRGFTHQEAMRIFTEGDDRIDPAAHFDPALLAVVTRCHEGMDAIWTRLAG